MKKNGILNKDIMEVITGMGHTDKIAIADAGLPIPDGVKRIDLTILKGMPPFLPTLEAILKEFQVEGAIIAKEMGDNNISMYRSIKTSLRHIEIDEVSHEDFKKDLKNCKAVIRTGECSPYSNVILISGVIF